MCTATFMNIKVREHSTYEFKKSWHRIILMWISQLYIRKFGRVKYFNTLNSSGESWLRHSYDFDVLGHGWSLCVTASVEIPSFVDGSQQFIYEQQKMPFQNVLASVIVIWLMKAEKLSDYARQIFSTSLLRNLTRTANRQRHWITPKCMASILPAMSVFTCSATFTVLTAISNPMVRTHWVICEVEPAA